MADSKVIKQVHPQYSDRQENWEFFLQSYEGGSNYFTKENIFTHTREHYDDYTQRLKRAHYQNYCGTIISIYTGYLFQKPVTRNAEGDEEFNTFWQDVDRGGSRIDDFLQNIADLMQVFGHVGILIDKPRTNGDILSKADEQENGIVPYYTVIYPTNIINWELDANNNFIWARVQEIYQTQPDPFKERTTITRYRTYTRDEWFIHDDEGKLIDKGYHGLGEVPLVLVYNKRLKRYPLFGWSSIEDLAYINRALANLSSMIDEFIYRQCFDQLILPASAVPGDEETEGVMKIGTSNAWAIPDDVGFNPMYLAPPTEPAQFLIDYENKLREIIYKLAQVEAPDFEPQSQSGVSKQWDFSQTNQNLSHKASNLEEAEIKCSRIRAKWMDKEWQGTITYPREFDVQAVNATLENALRVKMYQLPKSFQQEFDKTLYRKLLPRLSKDLIVKIDKDIEAGTTRLNQVSEAEEETVNRITQRLQNI